MSANDPVSEDSFRLREYVGVLRVRKWSIIAITLLSVLAALFYLQRQNEQFTSSAKVLATNPTAAFSVTPALAQPDMATEVALVSSTQVSKCAQQLVFQALGQPVVEPTPSPAASGSPSAAPSGSAAPSPVPSASTATVLTPEELCAPAVLDQVTLVPGTKKGLAVVNPVETNILQISYSAANRGKAQAGAEAFANAYITVSTIKANDYVASRQGPLKSQLAAKNKLLAAAYAKELSAAQSGDSSLQAIYAAQVNTLQQEILSLNEQLGALSYSLLEYPTLETEPTLPPGPSSPNKPLIIAAGLFVGLALGIGVAFLRERLDDRLRGRGDLEEHLGAPVLAVVPRVPGWKKKGEPKLISIEQPKASVAESYRTLRTSVLFAAAQRGLKTLMVTSPTAGEGKTTTAANLAVVLADAGKRVILVSADLRKPRIHQFFGLSNETGLSSVLTGEAKPWEALADPGREYLRVMSSGPVPAHPAELLQSEQMGELVEELREVADFVILDTAPVLLVADALGLAPLVDGVLFVVDAETTHRGAVVQARESLGQVGAPLIGSVLNNFDPSKARAYSYYGYSGPYRNRYRSGYGYGYGGYYGSGGGSGYLAETSRDGEARQRALDLPPDQAQH